MNTEHVMRLKIRVYYEDTDCGGVVYYANYLRYMERGRTEFLRETGISLDTYHRQGIVFAVTETHVTYRASARYDDLLDIETNLAEATSVTLTFDTKIFNQNGVLLNTGRTKMACVNEKGRACRIPAGIIEKLSAG